MASKVRLALGSSAIAFVFGAWAIPAAAQEENAVAVLHSTASPDSGVQDGGDSIVVTGTNISGVKAVGSESITIGREEILSSGKSSVADLVRTLPQVQNLGFNSSSRGANATQSDNANRGNSINLRGIGQGATLILVDGHRITPSGTAGAFTEANQVPFAAIERIEIIADGASAIYGSDAISGVVNYVLRKDYQGVELSARYTAGAYGNDEYALSAVAGTRWNSGLGEGNIIATYEYTRRNPFVRGKNPRLRQDQTAFGGPDFRIDDTGATVGRAGNIVLPIQIEVAPGFFIPGPRNPAFPQGGSNIYYALPDNPNGNPLSLADLTVNSANLVDRSDFEDYQGQLDRHQFAVLLNQEIGDSIEIYNQLFFTRSDQVTRTFVSNNVAGTTLVNVPAFLSDGSPNPNYIAGVPGLAPGAPIPVQINLLERVSPNGPRFQNDNPDESWNNTFGIRASLFGDWRGELYYTYGQNKTCGVCYIGNYVNNEPDATGVSALQKAVNDGIIDPFSTAPWTQDQMRSFMGTNSQYAQNYSHDVVLKFDGTVFSIPGGDVKVAIGGEYYRGIQKLQNAANRGADNAFVPDANARTVRNQYAVFGETYVPLVSDDMDVPLIQSLALSAALRYDHYSDFGSTTNPKISATWELSDDLAFRGSWGTAFRAPGLPELNSGVFSVGLGLVTQLPPGVTDIPNNFGFTNALVIIGGNSDLQAEQGETWQIGADFTPTFAPGLRVSATYYNIAYSNKFFNNLPAFTYLASAANRDVYSNYIIPINNPGSCVNGNPGTYDPALQDYYSFLYAANLGFDPRSSCSINVVLDGRFASVADTTQDGLDISASYTFDTGIGSFDIAASANKILNNTEQLGPGVPLNSALDTVGDPISFRARGSLGYRTGGFGASLFVNHVGGYRNDLPLTIAGVQQQPVDIPAWTTFDLSLNYQFPMAGNGVLAGTRFGATVTNLFNNDPPLVFSTINSGSSIDQMAHNALGRYIQLQITKAF